MLLLCTSLSYAQLNIGTPNNINICDLNNDGFGVFDFSSNTTVVLNALNPNEYAVTYHETYEMSEFGTDPITDITTYSTYMVTQTIYVRVTQIDTPTNYALTSFTLNALPTPVTSPSSLVFFDMDGVNDNTIKLNLHLLKSEILGNLSNDLYGVIFYETLAEATSGSSSIPDPSNYTIFTKTLYYRVYNLTTSCFSINEISITILPEDAQLDIGTPNDLEACADNYDGFGYFDLSVNNEIILNGLDPNDYSIDYYLTLYGSIFHDNNKITDITSYYTTVPTIFFRVTQISTPENYAVGAFQLIIKPRPVPSAISTIVVFDTDDATDNTTTIDLNSYNTAVLENNDQTTTTVSYYLTLPEALSGTGAIASPFTTASTTIYYRIERINSCIATGSISIVVLPEDYQTEQPTGAANQTFTDGERLSDLEVTGENIKWYDTPGGTTGLPFKPKNNDTPLPLSTVLVNNTTYYASQTLNTIESTSRLAVTVTTTMGTDKNTFTTLRYYPNPVNDILTVTNSNNIETLTVINMLGKTIISKHINSTNTQLDLSSLNNGVYFVKIASEGKNKTLKIIKE